MVIYFLLYLQLNFMGIAATACNNGGRAVEAKKNRIYIEKHEGFP